MSAATRLAASAALLRAAQHGLLNSLPRWARWASLLLLLGAPLALGAWLGGAVGRGVGLALAVVVALCLWALLCYSLQEQNRPQLARLLPGHVAALRHTLVGGWLLVVAAMLPLSWALTGSPWSYTGFTAGVMLMLALVARWPLLWLVIWLPGSALPWLARQPLLREPMAELQFWLHAHPLPALCLGLLAGALLLRSTLGDGDAAHRQRHQQRQIWRELSRNQGSHRSVWRQGSLWDRMQGFGRSAYLRLLQRPLPAHAQGRQRFARMALAMGPQAHWSGQLMQLPYVWTVLLVMGLLTGLITSPFTSPFGRPIEPSTPAFQGLGHLSFGALFYLLSVLQQTQGALAQTRHEQGLARLLPGMPQQAELNRRLLQLLSVQYLLHWALVWAPLAMMLWQVPAAHDQLLAFALASLLAGVTLWRNWARWPQRAVLGMVLHYLVPPLLGALAWLALHRGWLNDATLALGLLGGLLLLGAWVWPRLLRAPAAWPTGRAG